MSERKSWEVQELKEYDFLLRANDELKGRLRAARREIKYLKEKNTILNNRKSRLQSFIKINSINPVYKKEKNKAFDAQWHLVYSDLFTLLLVFFVVLFSYSKIDLVKFKHIISSFMGNKVVNEYIDPSSNDIIFDMSKRIIGDGIQLEYKQNIVIITINEKVLFPSGKKDLLEKANPLLMKVVKLFDVMPGYYNIYVEGHTDDRPIHTKQFPSNLELSAARALSVARFFIDQAKVASDKIVVSGFAHYRPVAPNDTKENRARNRRVEIKLKRERGQGSGVGD